MLSHILNITRGDKIAVVGCGGKTSLVECLAFENAAKKVLVSPATKIFPMRHENVILCTTKDACVAHSASVGVQCLGIGSKKLEALPLLLLEELAHGYDIVLMEADGSRGLLCKGYKDYEPVIPPFTNCTIGVVNILALGQVALPEFVHRLPEFLMQTGLKRGDGIHTPALAAMVARMMKDACGRAILVINGVTNPSLFEAAQKLAGMTEGIDTFVAGCTHKNTWGQV